MESNEKQPTPEEELAAYEKFRQRVSKILSELQGKITAENISQAIDKTTAELKDVGEFSKEALGLAAETLKKDIASTGEYVKPKLNELSQDAHKRFDDWLDKGGEWWREISQESEYLMELSRDKGGGFLLNITTALNEWSEKAGRKLQESLTYKSGELTHGGKFSCLKCSGEIHLKKPGHIPPCPKCRNAEFQRS